MLHTLMDTKPISNQPFQTAIFSSLSLPFWASLQWLSHEKWTLFEMDTLLNIIF